MSRSWCVGIPVFAGNRASCQRQQSPVCGHVVFRRSVGCADRARRRVLCTRGHGEPDQGTTTATVRRSHELCHHAGEPVAAVALLGSLHLAGRPPPTRAKEHRAGQSPTRDDSSEAPKIGVPCYGHCAEGVGLVGGGLSLSPRLRTCLGESLAIAPTPCPAEGVSFRHAGCVRMRGNAPQNEFLVGFDAESARKPRKNRGLSRGGRESGHEPHRRRHADRPAVVPRAPAGAPARLASPPAPRDPAPPRPAPPRGEKCGLRMRSCKTHAAGNHQGLAFGVRRAARRARTRRWKAATSRRSPQGRPASA